MRKNFSIWFLLPSIIFGACIAEIKAQPSNEALFTRASDSVKAGKYDEAIQYLTQIITSTPNSYKAHLLRGICYWGKKELEYAEIQKDPARAYRLEAEIYGNLKPGEVQTKSASSLSAIADLTRAIQLDPTAFSPYNIRGKVYLREKDLEPAIADFQKVIELKRDYQQEPTLKGLNETLIKTRNEYAKSLQMRAINLKISIGYSKEYQAKATGEELKRARIQTEENEKIYRSLLTKAAQTFAPNDFYTFNGRGDCYEDLENWNAALADFSEAIKFRPNDLSLINKRAAVYDKIGNKEKAISDLSIVIAKQNVPQNEKFYQNEAYFKRAKLYTEQGKLNEALADLDKAIADNPKYYIAYLERGKLHAAKGSKQLARADFVKAGGTPNLLAISKKEIDILDGKIKPKAEAPTPVRTNQAAAKTSSTAQPSGSSFTFVRIPAPEPFESQFQQMMKDAPNKTNPSLHRKTTLINFYKAVEKSSLADADKKKYIGSKFLEVAAVDMYAAYETLSDADIKNAYVTPIIEGMPREMRKKMREASSLEVQAYLNKTPKPRIEDIFPPGIGWGQTVSSNTLSSGAAQASQGAKSETEYEELLIAAEMLKKWDEVVTYATSLIQIKPLNAADYLTTRCNAFNELKKLDLAMKDCNEALQKQPDFDLALIRRSRTHYLFRNFEAAIKDLTKATETSKSKKNITISFYLRGSINREMGNRVAAINDYREVLKLDPNYSEAKNALKRLGDPQNSANPVKQGNADQSQADRNTVDGVLEALQGEVWLNKGDVADKAKNYTEALNWYRKASEQGYERATYNIGTYYYSGLGVEKNYAEAMIWFKIAVNNGYANAMFNLAVMYYNGQGVGKNNTQAVYWFRKAAKKGVQAAKDALKKMNVSET